MIVVVNFAPVLRTHYRIGVPWEGKYTELFNSDDVKYGGQGYGNPDTIVSEMVPMHGKEQSVQLTLPPLGILFLQYNKNQKKRVKIKETEKHTPTSLQTAY